MTGHPPQSVRIEPATPQDAAAIARLCRATFPGAPEWRAPIWICARWWRSLAARAGCLPLVAKDEHDRLLGFVIDIADPDAWSAASRSGPHSKPIKALVALTRPSILRARIRKRRAAKGVCKATPTNSSVRTDQSPRSEPRLFLELLVVSPAAKGRGIGSALLKRVEEHARLRQTYLVKLLVDPRNQAAHAFYTRHGYRMNGTDKGSAVMIKELEITA